MKKIIPLIICTLLICIGCKSIKESIKHESVTDVQVIYRDFYDTITKEKEVVRDSNLLSKIEEQYGVMKYQTDSIDSLTVANALKDSRIRTLVYQLSKNSLTIQPIFVHEDYAWAEAGITNNKLYLKLHQNEIVNHIQSADSVKTITNTTKTVREVHEPWYKDFKTWCIIILVIVIISYTMVLIRISRK